MRGWTLAALCGLMLGGLTISGCSGDDDKKGGGGGTTVFPGIPTARPDITGFPVVIDASGRTSGPTTTGGAGGTVTIATGTGDLRKDDGRSLPGISTNFLTPAVLADNSVNYTELSAIDPAAVTVTGNTAVLDLVGVDFHVPAGVNLILADLILVFGLDTLLIRAHGPGDVIRIDGLVQGGPIGAFTGVHVSFESLTNPGTAIAISGTINLEPSSNNGLAGGNFSAHADQGSILVRGTISSIGSAMTTGICGPGGNISLFADRGSILLREGIIQANGGNGDDAGGGGGTVIVLTPHHLEKQRVPFGFRANGGNATGTGDGGNGGFISLTMRSPLDLFAVCEVNGGNSAGDDGGAAGVCNVVGMIVQGVLVLNASGGNGDESGGDQAGTCAVAGESLTGLAVVATRNGGNSTTDAGGDGGTVVLAIDGRFCVNVLLEVTANGGSGLSQGGNAGGGFFQTFGELRNANLVAVANGGAGDIAGNGGSVGLLNPSALGEPLEINVDAQLHGGAGETIAGDAGSVTINAGASVLTTEVNVIANGGNLVGAPSAASSGGDGGILDIGLGLSTSVNAIVSGSLVGGNGGTVGNGGTGGTLRARVGINGSDLRLNTVGTLDLRGGSASAGIGGRGGFAGISCGVGGLFDSNVLNLDLRGGDSTGGDGGDGFSSGGDAFEGIFGGPAWFRGGTINISGGNGSTSSGTGVGGVWGSALIETLAHDIHFGATLIANGGNGVSEGGGVTTGSTIEINADSNSDGIAGTIRVTGTLRSRGGDASDGVGGDGGFIYIHAFDNLTPISGGDTYISGLVECIGGTGAGTNGVGGEATGIEISTAGNVFDISGSVRLVGGDGPAGGDMGNLELGASAITNIRISGTVEALGGTASGVAVSGPLVLISTPAFSDEAATITVTASAVIRSNGGAGGTTDGGAGFISFDAQGAGTNVTIDAGATVECLDGAGVSAPANITIN